MVGGAASTAAESRLADSGIPRVAIDLAEAVLGTIAAEFLVANESRETLKAVPEHRAGGALDRTPARRRTGKSSICGARIRARDRAGEGISACAGVDVQDDRLEVEIKAYGRGKESWVG